jgi:hypothetical protein
VANNPKFSNAAVNAEADALGAMFDNGYLRIYDGAQPANADIAVGAQVLLAELRFNADAFPAAVNGVITANALTADAAANATGTATWFRALKSDGTTVIMDGSVGEATSDIVLDSDAIQQDADVSVTSFVLTISKG